MRNTDEKRTGREKKIVAVFAGERRSVAGICVLTLLR